jgi:hypothetical protein
MASASAALAGAGTVLTSAVTSLDESRANRIAPSWAVPPQAVPCRAARGLSWGHVTQAR